MIKNNDDKDKSMIRETGNIVSSFKKFSEMNSTKSKEKEEDASLEISADDASALPANYNIANTKTKRGVSADTSSIQPEPENAKKTDKIETAEEEQKSENVKYYGKVAKFNKKVKAANAYNYLESVKISKNSIWYIMIEKMENSLQLVKFNYKAGVDLSKFVNELKTYYKKIYNTNEKVKSLIENISIEGNDKFSSITNIPLIEIEGKKMISRITEDLIKLLSK